MPESSCALARQNQRSNWFCLEFSFVTFLCFKTKKSKNITMQEHDDLTAIGRRQGKKNNTIYSKVTTSVSSFLIVKVWLNTNPLPIALKLILENSSFGILYLFVK